MLNYLHILLQVPVGTLFKLNGTCVADLNEEGDMFIAARGGAGGKGNAFFANSMYASFFFFHRRT